MTQSHAKVMQCPSGHPGFPDAQVFGIVNAQPGDVKVAWLETPIPLTAELLAMTGDVDPQRVFRITSSCQESSCTHFDGHDCQLATRIVQILPAVVDALPPCQLRANCRWYVQEGKPACFRCPQIITHHYEPSDAEVRAATPA